jgi:Type VI secretion system VasI, EvfG, VC_A0118
MKCAQCGANNETDARFCKACGKDMSSRAVAAASNKAAKGGGFHRFCLGGAAVWTFFLIGTFLGIGMSMVSHGINDPTVFGLGFGLGFIFFAGVWFIGIVVLLLLAMVTKPSPPVKWPSSAKVSTALLSLLAFFWPMFRAVNVDPSRAPTATPNQATSSGQNSGAAVDPWQVREDTSPMDSTKRVVLSNDAENEINVWLGSKRATLILRCQERKTNAYVLTGSAASVEYGTDSHTVRLRFDDANPVTQHWSESTDREALFAPNAVRLAKQIANAKKLTFEFTPFNASPAVVYFKVEGLRAHLGKLSGACGW